MTSADEAGDSGLAGQSLRVAQDVDRARVRAARHDDQPTVLDVDDDVLVVPDHGIGLPVLAGAREVNRKSALEAGGALDLPRDEDGVVDEQRLSAFLHDVDSLGLEVGSTRRRQADLGSGRKDDLALAPRFGMDDQRQPQASVAREQALQATVVIRVAVRDHDRAQVLHANLEHVEIAGQAVGRQSRVVEDAAPTPVVLDRDQRREPVLRNELAATAEVVLDVPRNALRRRQQDVDEVVHHDRDLRPVDGLQGHGFAGHRRHLARRRVVAPSSPGRRRFWGL
jgi:hypothetical protein